MTEQYIGWALVVGGVLGGALVWFILGRLPRHTEDVAPAERREEALWIARVVESRGGIAPPALVDEVLELHGEYLAGPALDVRPQPPAPVGRATTDGEATEVEAMADDHASYEDAGARLNVAESAEWDSVGDAGTAQPRRTSELADEDRNAV